MTGENAGPDPASDHAPCPICRGPVERRPRERPSGWRDRKTCSPKCKSALASIRLTRDPAKFGEHPGCSIAGCKNPVVRHPGEQRAKWMERKTCGQLCLSKLRAEQIEKTAATTAAGYFARRREAALDYVHPPCTNPECRRPVEIRADEEPNCWRKRKTCSAPCLHAIRRKPDSVRAMRDANRAADEARPTKRAVTAKRAALRYGRSPEKRQKRSGPVHFETVEQALARGVPIEQCPPAYAAPVAGAGISANGRIA